jgi:hypothetical protein
MRRPVIIAGLLLPIVSPAKAEHFDTARGNDLFQACQDTNHATFDSGVCMGFIQGVSTVANGVFYCPPAGATYGQSIDIVVAGLRNHPEERQRESDSLIIKYLRAAWPCEKK